MFRVTTLFAAIALSGSALAAEVVLPDGWAGRVSSTCAESAEKVFVRSEEGSWTVKPGNRLVKASPAGTAWSVVCGGASARTNCLHDGYVIVVFQPGSMVLACYSGPIPDNLTTD